MPGCWSAGALCRQRETCIVRGRSKKNDPSVRTPDAVATMTMATLVLGSGAEDCLAGTPAISGATISSPAWQEADKGLPERCLVAGKTALRAIDGKSDAT